MQIPGGERPPPPAAPADIWHLLWRCALSSSSSSQDVKCRGPGVRGHALTPKVCQRPKASCHPLLPICADQNLIEDANHFLPWDNP
jgi:hypothetical protein